MRLPHYLRALRVATFGLLIAVAAGRVTAAEAVVAVAANFAEAAGQLESDFEAATGHALTMSIGSTGKLYAQILNGAPFDVLLAADQERPRRLIEAGLAVDASRFTYAAGRLGLWSAKPGLVGPDGAATLRRGGFRHLALANPKLAPYGAAARQVMQRLGLWDSLQRRLVLGEDVGQAFALVASGNAELGFVALSQVLSARNPTPGSHWPVPPELHQPIRQDAVLLRRAADNVAARAFLEYLQSPTARTLLERGGYGPAPARSAAAAEATAIPDLAPLWLTLQLAGMTVLVLLLIGTPLAWWLAHTRTRLKVAVEALTALPLVLPPTVLGFYLLVLLSPETPLGAAWISLTGDTLTFSFAGLVVASVLYSMPFVVQPLQGAFEAVGRAPLEAAATLRAAPLDAFFTVAAPLAARGYLTAVVLGFAHTLGEFGVVLMVGGNIPGRTKVISIAIYEHVETLEYAQAHVLAAGMLVFSFIVLLAVYAVNRRARIRAG